MWSICTSRVINMHQSCDWYAPVMWLICTSHVIDMHQSCDQYAPVMWLICTSRVINMHQSCDQYAPVMWSISTSHVIDRHQSCDQYAPVVWSICAIWPTVWSRDGHSYVTQGCLKPGNTCPLCVAWFIYLVITCSALTYITALTIFYLCQL